MRKLAAFVAVVGLVTFAILCLGKKNAKKVEPTTAKTEFRVVNSSADSVLMYLTLSGYPDSVATNYVQNVDSVLGCTQVGLNGWTYIHANDSVSYTSSKYFSGNISFGTQPLNCFNTLWPTGMNLFEFNLNEPQESLDISCMAGVNCIMKTELIGGPSWPASVLYPDPRILQNDSMYKNTGKVGVYPYGCTNCTNTEGKQSCQTPSETPDTLAICNPTRAKGQNGGLVRVSFKGYTNLKICSK